MPDPRAINVQRFRESQGATRVHILTTIQPFTVSQDRSVVLERPGGAWLIHGSRCTPHTPLGHGRTRRIDDETLTAFLQRLDAADAAWDSDAIPAGIHDGVTITIERAEDGDYRRTRMVEPPEGSAHERLLAAWMTTFPEVAHALT
jgi:hypothetical protein